MILKRELGFLRTIESLPFLHGGGGPTVCHANQKGGVGFRALQISVVLEDALDGDTRGASGMMMIIRCRGGAKW
jgi:hypothetical protein